MKKRPILPGAFLAAFLVLFSAVTFHPRAAWAASSPSAETASPRALTLMIYLCGSNLESSYGSASADLAEIRSSDFDPKQVTVLAMTGGSFSWAEGYDPAKTHILEIQPGRSRGVWSGDLLNMGSGAALEQLLRFGMEKYPAREYALILWDHGGGPMEGLCWDELFSMDQLTLSELEQALKNARLPGKLRWIGFDACLMGSAEVAAAMAPYAEYMIASQETEPACGWNYAFLDGIELDKSGADTGRRIIDTYFAAPAGNGAVMTLACVDLAKISNIQTTLDQFFTPISRDVSADSFSRLSDIRFNTSAFGKAPGRAESQGYDLVDLQDLITRYSKNTSGRRALAAVQDAIVYSRSSIEGAGGLSVYHPYENKQQYLSRWRDEYEAMDFCGGYAEYIGRFGAILTGETLAGWAGLRTEKQTEENLYTLQMTPAQQETFVSAQLIVLAAQDRRNGVYGTQATSLEGAEKGDTLYSPVYVAEAVPDENGLIRAPYAGRAIYATDGQGNPVIGPLAYEMSDDGTVYFVHGLYQDRSGREDFAADMKVIFGLSMESGEELRITAVRGYDSATKTYTSRVPVTESAYTHLQFYPLTRKMPADTSALPGFESWESDNTLNTAGAAIRLPDTWHFRFFPDQMSASQLFAAIQITDSQHSTHMGTPAAVENPNLEKVDITPAALETADYRIKIDFVRDTSPMNPGLNLIVEATNLSRWEENIILDHILLNETRCAAPMVYTPIYVYSLPPRETAVKILHIDQSALAGLGQITSLSASLTLQQSSHQRLTKETIRFDIDRLDLARIAPAAPEPCAIAEADGIEWQLCALERNARGDLTGLLCVSNHSGRELSGFASLAVNGLLIDGTGSLIIEVAPGTTAYLPFTLDNSAILKSALMLNGQRHWYWLATQNAMAQYGIREIRDLRILLQSGYQLISEANLILPSPFALGESEELTASSETDGGIAAGQTMPESSLLMTGQVEARVERVLRAENGVGLQLVFENRMEHAATVAIGHRRLNQHTLSSAAPFLTIPAGGRTVYSLGLTSDTIEKRGGANVLVSGHEEGEIITEIGMCFQIDNAFSTRDAVLRLNPAAGNGYLTTENWTTVPAVYDPPAFIVEPDTLSVSDGAVRVSLSGRFLNGSQAIFDQDRYDAGETHLELDIQVANQTGSPQNFSVDRLIINGTRAVDQRWYFGEMAAESSGSSAMSFDLAQLRGIPEIRDISFDLSWYPPGEYGKRETHRVRFDVRNCDISVFVPETPPVLAEGTDGEISWELGAVTEDSQAGDEITMLLRARNDGIEPTPPQYVYLAVDTFSAAQFWLQALPPGGDQWLTVVLPNETRIPSYEIEVYQYPYPSGKRYFLAETHLLEHRGVADVREITLMRELNYYSAEPRAGRSVTLSLINPVPLEPSEVNSGLPYTPEEGKVGIFPICLLAGDNGAALCLDIVNDTEDLLLLKAPAATVNGIPCEIYNQDSFSITVLPKTTQTAHLSILTSGEPEAFPTGHLIREITLEIGTQTGSTFSGRLTLAREAPLGAEGGVLIPGAEIYRDISRAEALLNTVPRLTTEPLRPVRLAPALSAAEIARFESGTATLMADRAESVLDRTEGAEEYLPARIDLCQAPLVLGADGVLAADFPGLIWTNAQGQPLEYYALNIPDLEEGEHLIAMGIALFTDTDIPTQGTLDIPLDETAYDYSETAAFLLYIAQDGTSSLTGALLEAYTPGGEEVTQQVREENRIVIGAVDRKGMILRKDTPVGVFYDRFPILSLENMRLVPVSEYAGQKVVLYQINYTDGTSVSFFEPFADEY